MTLTTAVVVGMLVAAPLVLLVWRSLTPAGGISLDAYRAAFDDVPLVEVAGTTAVFAVGAAAIGLVIGLVLAFVLVRTDVPARRTLFVLAIAPLVLPGILQTIAWIFLAAPQSGLFSSVPGVPSVLALAGWCSSRGSVSCR